MGKTYRYDKDNDGGDYRGRRHNQRDEDRDDFDMDELEAMREWQERRRED